MKLLNVALFQIAVIALLLGGLLFVSNTSKVNGDSSIKNENLVWYCDSNGVCNASLSTVK